MLVENGSLVAVYGSLREGLGNHRVLNTNNNGSTRKEDGLIPKNKFTMHSLVNFPGLVKDSLSDVEIVVEVYEVNTQGTAQDIDWLEGYPSFYDRELVELKDGRSCWVYFVDEVYKSNPEVLSGDWVKYYSSDRGGL